MSAWIGAQNWDGEKMGIINMVKTIKQVHPNDVVFIKVGNFFHVYGKDSYIISYFFAYKLKKIENISSCGFPSNSLNKIIAKLEENKVNYIIVDRRNNYEIDEISDNRNLNNYIKIFKKAKIYVNYKTRIDNINNFMLENIDKENFKIIIQKMEEVIDERRKISSN